MFSYLSAEQRVRVNHPLRPIRTTVDTVLKGLSRSVIGQRPVGVHQPSALSGWGYLVPADARKPRKPSLARFANCGSKTTVPANFTCRWWKHSATRSSRDATLTRLTILADGKTLGAAAYGAVFTKDQLNFTYSVFISAESAPTVGGDFD